MLNIINGYGFWITGVRSIRHVMFGLFYLAGVAQAAAPSITDFWLGKASFKFIRSYTAQDIHAGRITNLGPGITGGVRIKVVGQTWYLFMRRVETEMSLPTYCPNQNSRLLSIVVSQSVDEGLTWSKPVKIIHPETNSALECGVTDGDFYFDTSQNKWHALFQCLSRTGWQGCYASKMGEDPMGEFVTDPGNPVIPAGSLWSKICTNCLKQCYRWAGGANKIKDEGTFDIFEIKDGYYYIDFHGYDGLHGYRGLIKTKDFHNWEIVTAGSILNQSDTLKFNTIWDKNGSVGFGAGRIIKDNGYYYLISEAVDRNLACTPGQNWVWGLFRTKSLTAKSWEDFSGNPFFTINNFPKHEEGRLPCNPAYLGIFVSQVGRTYLHASYPSINNQLDGIYLFKLISNEP